MLEECRPQSFYIFTAVISKNGYFHLLTYSELRLKFALNIYTSSQNDLGFRQPSPKTHINCFLIKEKVERKRILNQNNFTKTQLKKIKHLILNNIAKCNFLAISLVPTLVPHHKLKQNIGHQARCVRLFKPRRDFTNTL